MINEQGYFNLGFDADGRGTGGLNIKAGGNVGIGTSSPTAQLTNTGTVRFASLGSAGGSLITDADGNVTVSSDERLKDISGQFTRGLAAIQGLNPITYHWKPETGYDTINAYTGFSAQNVQSAIPEAVVTSANGHLSLADRPILAAAVNAIKELSQTLSSLYNGVAQIFVQKVTTKELCLDDVCITKDQLRELLNRNGVSVPQSTVYVAPSSTPATIIVTDITSTSTTSTSTQQDVSTTTVPTVTPTVTETIVEAPTLEATTTPSETPEPTPVPEPASVQESAPTPVDTPVADSQPAPEPSDAPAPAN
jgi:hypothetical protein